MAEINVLSSEDLPNECHECDCGETEFSLPNQCCPKSGYDFWRIGNGLCELRCHQCKSTQIAFYVLDHEGVAIKLHEQSKY